VAWRDKDRALYSLKSLFPCGLKGAMVVNEFPLLYFTLVFDRVDHVALLEYTLLFSFFMQGSSNAAWALPLFLLLLFMYSSAEDLLFSLDRPLYPAGKNRSTAPSDSQSREWFPLPSLFFVVRERMRLRSSSFFLPFSGWEIAFSLPPRKGLSIDFPEG